MASDLQEKSKQTSTAITLPVNDRKPIELPSDLGASSFTEEQRQILGNVYQLILGWRRERLMKAMPQDTLTVEREA